MNKSGYSVSPEIVRDIARITTLATPGVLNLTEVGGVFHTVTGDAYHGVEVDLRDHAASVRLHVVASADQALPELGQTIQANVADAVNELTGIQVERVDITFEDVRSER